MQNNCYKILRIVYANLFLKSIKFANFADDLGYEETFLINISPKKISK